MPDKDSEIKVEAKTENKPKCEFFKNTAIGNETYLGSQGQYTGNSLRVGVDALKSPYGSINTKLLFNSNDKNQLSESLRVTTSSPSLNLGKVGGTSFSSNIENWTNYNFNTQKTTNTARVKLNATQKKLGLKEYLVTKSAWDCKNSPEFKGFTIGLQKDFKLLGKNVYAYGENYMPPECIKGVFKNSTYGLGFGVKL